MWSKVKTSLRRTAARTHEKLLEAIAAVLVKNAKEWLTSCGCKNDSTHCDLTCLLDDHAVRSRRYRM